MSLQTKNQILQRLTPEDFSAIEALLRPVDLDMRQEIVTVGQVIERVYFPESGICSIMAVSPGSEAIECGLFGRDGLSDQVFVPGDISPLKSIVQKAGTALVLEAADYLKWTSERPSAAHLVSKYQRALTVQVSFTALSHGSFTIVERLARWLLMSFDRTDENELPYVHEFLASMLAVRRAGVTDAVHVLEGDGAIKATRGRIVLRDRGVLEEIAGGSYGIPEAEYLRLMGPLPQAP
jgi:CRP-like cAMP-binding protein